VGAWLDDLRRARISQHRRNAGRRVRDRRDRAGAGEGGVSENRRIERDTLGDDDVTAVSARTRSTLRATVTIAAALALYEIVARTGYFPPALMPSLTKVWSALIGSLDDGTMLWHAATTRYRLIARITVL